MLVADFLTRWSGAPARERAHYQQFFVELCDVIDLPRPDPARDGEHYCFERPVPLTHPDGKTTVGRIDLYRRGAVVLEFKQGSGGETAGPRGTARRGTAGWDDAMRKAFAQGRAYALSLPGRKVPFLLTCDIGYTFEIWSDFAETGSYGDYGARRTLPLSELTKPEVRAQLRALFLDPLSLDPSRKAARVTREIARHLAGLARELEASGHPPALVARFLMGCLFTMFAEDVGLLSDGIFTDALQSRWLPHPETFASGLTHLWQTMDRGGVFGFHGSVLRFNGGLFRNLEALSLDRSALERLIEAARCDWSDVEPAIFGTLLERALDPRERARLGAHFTPRAYIERLVKPTVIEPLRADWQLVQAEVRLLLVDNLADEKARRKAIELYRAFHANLCKLRVLDPATGSGNFLYVTFDLLKQLEAEVLRELSDLGEQQELLGLSGVTVNPSQFLGIERNPRAREVADLVLWLGFLQWQRRTQGDKRPPEPVLREYQNIEARDAVLTWRRETPRLDEEGRIVSVWDMASYKQSPITGEQIPDETARVPVQDYVDPGQAVWPDADFIIGNPPFVGNKMMRAYLGDGYTEALRAAWPEVPQTADLVMYWIARASERVRAGVTRRFGLITTNSITQVFNRKVIEPHLSATEHPLALCWAIPDHPWVDDGADVRIAMTVGARAEDLHERPVLGRVVAERADPADEGGVVTVEVEVRAVDRIFADLKAGADVAGATRLRANQGLSFQGMNLVGKGFRLTPEEVVSLGYDLGDLPPVIRLYKNARDLTQGGETRYVIDLYGLSQDEAREQHPRLYQWLLERVKPERDQNKRTSYRDRWWIFAEARSGLRRTWTGLSRTIITPITARHRIFEFAPAALLPDCQLMVICSEDALIHGVLSSRIHECWSLAAASRMGIGNDPRWRNGPCFDPFPFPEATTPQKTRIRTLAQRLDTHRKRVEATDPKFYLTAQYNALLRHREALSTGPPLSPTERSFHDRALIGMLAEIHDQLDAAVAEAYGWPADLPDDEILLRLCALNRTRAAEELAGHVRWLRPELQAPTALATQTALPGVAAPDEEATDETPKALPPWPRALAEQLAVVRALFLRTPAALCAEEVARTFKGARRPAVEAALACLAGLGLLTARADESPPRYLAPARSDVG